MDKHTPGPWPMAYSVENKCYAIGDTRRNERRLDRIFMRDHDPNHPYVRRMIGCGHGVLFSEPCVECEIVGLLDEYKRAVKTVMRVRDRMRQLGRPMPGRTS